MRVIVCGARGSTPVSRREFARHGGETSCVAIARDGEDPCLVLDAGTGLRLLTGFMSGRAFSGTVILSHLHWDHVQGFPFFAAGRRSDARVRVVIPAQDLDPYEVLARAFSPPYFPIGVTDLEGQWSVEEMAEGEGDVEGFSVLARRIPHKGGVTFGYRVSNQEASVAYLPDHSPTSLGPGPDGLGEVHDAALDLCRDADLVIHDAQHLAAEFPQKAPLGHATIEYALRLAETSGARKLLLFHHDPDRSDEELDHLQRLCTSHRVEVKAAAVGDVVTVPQPG